MYSQLTQKAHWKVIETTNSPAHAMQQVRSGVVSLVIIDDSVMKPSCFYVRQFITDPQMICTPMLAFSLADRNIDAAALMKLGCDVVTKPITPATFLPKFNELIRRWESPPHTTLRKLSYLHTKVADEQLLPTLTKLMAEQEIQHLCAQYIAIKLRRQNRFKEAEQILLGAIKRAPKQLSTVLALVDLYFQAGSPKIAYQVLTSARNAHGATRVVVPDLAQAAIMLGRIDEAIDTLQQITKTENPDPLSIDFLSRLLYAAGRDNEAEQLLHRIGKSFKKFQSSWLNAESPPALPAAS
jgi:DNA-binding response OmpR family regulator